MAYYGSWPMSYVQPPEGKFHIEVLLPKVHSVRHDRVLEPAWVQEAVRILYLHVNLTDWSTPNRDQMERDLEVLGFGITERIERTRGSLSGLERSAIVPG